MWVNHNILKNKKENDFLNKEGYVVLNLLSSENIQEFKDLFLKWHASPPQEFYKSYFSPKVEYKKEVEKKILEVFNSNLSSKFIDYRAFGGMFVVKPTGEKGHFPPHQDWSFVDETKFWSLNMWSPLVDVGEENGYLYVLPESHKFNKTIRGAHTPDTYAHLQDEILKNVKGIELKAGEALFFFHGLVHGSTINNANRERTSVGLSLVQDNVPLLYHYYNEDKQTTECFRVKDLSFYLNYVSNRDEKPEKNKDIEKLGMIDFQYQCLSKETFHLKMKNSSIKIKAKKSTFNKVLEKIKSLMI